VSTITSLYAREILDSRATRPSSRSAARVRRWGPRGGALGRVDPASAKRSSLRERRQTRYRRQGVKQGAHVEETIAPEIEGMEPPSRRRWIRRCSSSTARRTSSALGPTRSSRCRWPSPGSGHDAGCRSTPIWAASARLMPADAQRAQRRAHADNGITSRSSCWCRRARTSPTRSAWALGIPHAEGAPGQRRGSRRARDEGGFAPNLASNRRARSLLAGDREPGYPAGRRTSDGARRGGQRVPSRAAATGCGARTSCCRARSLIPSLRAAARSLSNRVIEDGLARTTWPLGPR